MKLIDVPISPNALEDDVLDEWWGTDLADHENVITQHVTADAGIFVILRRIAEVIAKGTMWNKKARIVLEYDPQIEKMRIATIMEYDEAIRSEPFSEWHREHQQ